MFDEYVKYRVPTDAYDGPMETMGDRIRYLRGVKGYSQTELGEKCGVTKAALSAWELGNTTNIKLQTFLLLCDVLGARPEYLIFGPDRGGSSSASGIHRKIVLPKS